MAPKCDVLVPEDTVLKLLSRPFLREKYQQFAFQDYVKSHPELRFCPGPNCQVLNEFALPAMQLFSNIHRIHR
jgi:ariadne-2